MCFDPQTIAVADHKDRPHTSPLEVSPALEADSPTPVSTHWIPLHELIVHWTEVDILLLPGPVAPVLAAIGHALLALSNETCALRLYTLAWKKQQWNGNAPARETDDQGHQTVQHLYEAGQQWTQAAVALDNLLPTDLDPPALERARRLSRVARIQQERLCRLAHEVGSDVETWSSQPGKEVGA